MIGRKLLHVLWVSLLVSLGIPSQVLAQISTLAPSDTKAINLSGHTSVGSLGELLYQLPIDVLPSGNSFVPQLSILHRSGLEGSFVGPGWTISGLSSISRCFAQKDVDGYHHSPDLSEADMFCLDGQKLIAVDGKYGEDGTEYRTKKESYQRIISYGRQGRGPEGFVVWKKTGEIEEYGFSSNAVISSAHDQSILSWGLSKVSDRFTNFVSISYLNSSNTLLPSRVSYGGNENAGLGHYSHIRFSYSARSNPISFYQVGIRAQNDRRLDSITVGRDHSDVWSYRLSYTGPANQQSTLRSVRKCVPSGECSEPISFSYEGSNQISFSKAELALSRYGNREGVWSQENAARIVADLNGNGLLDVLAISSYSDVSASYRRPDGSFDEKRFQTGLRSNYDARRDLIHLADVNNDGLPDIIAFLPRGVMVSLNSPNGFLEASYWLEDFNRANRWDWHNHIIQVADVNGNGYSDIIGFYDDGVYVAYGNGRNFAKPVKQISDFGRRGWAPDTSIRLVADINLDGYADIIGFNQDGLFVSYGSEAGFLPARLLNSELNTRQWPISRYPQHLFDMNGDGYLDIVSFRRDGIYVSLGNGSGFENATLWLKDFTYPEWDPAYHYFTFVDVNGDNIPDFVGMRDGLLRIVEGQGRPATNPKVFQSRLDFVGRWYGISHPVYFQDFDGNGIADIIAFMDYGVQVSKSSAESQRLSQIRDSFGNETRLNWKPLHDTSVHVASKNAKFPLIDLNGPLYVVSSIETSDGLGGMNRSSYRYEGAKFHTRGFGFLGFSRVISYDHSQSLRVEKTYNMDFTNLRVGHVERARTYLDPRGINSSGGVLLNQTDVVISSRALDSARRRFQVYEAEKTITNFDLSGNQTARIHHQNSVDGFGNTYEMTVRTSDAYGSYTTTVNTEFRNDTDNWLIGKALRTSVTKTRSGQNPITRSSSFDYDRDTGALSQIWEERGTPEETSIRYIRNQNNFGHIDSVVESWSASYPGLGFRQVESSYTYDELGFKRSERNPLGHQSIIETHEIWGAPEKITDPNGLSITYIFSSWGEIEDTRLADGRLVSTRRYRCDFSCPSRAHFYTMRNEPGQGRQYQYLDSLGRVIREASYGINGELIQKDEQYNSRGQIYRSSLPYVQNQAVYWTRFQYDDLGRITRKTLPDESFEEYVYTGLSKTFRNAKGHEHRYIYNSLGEKLEQIDPLGHSTKYFHDSRGLLSKVTDANNLSYTFGYDRFDRVITKSSPYQGLEEITYNGLGLVYESKDNKNQITRIQYDRLGRVIEKTYGLGRSDQQIETYVWDRSENGIGQLNQASAASYLESYNYDRYGRLSRTTFRIDQKSYPVSQSYDEYSRLNQVSYPSGFSYFHEYDEAGHLLGVLDDSRRRLWQLKEVYPDGSPRRFVQGANIESFYRQNPRNLMVEEFSVQAGSSNRESWTYEYDALLNLSARQDGFSIRETFTYDRLNRLSSTTTASGTRQVYDYDAIGNFKSRTDRGNYLYGKPNCGTNGRQGLEGLLIALEPPSSTIPMPRGPICYDGNGNITSGYTRAITYSPSDKPTRIDTDNWQVDIFYGLGQARYKRVDLDKRIGRLNTSLYLGSSLEIIEEAGRQKFRHFLPGDIVVTIDHQGRRSTEYLLKDPLGSVVGISNLEGAYERRRYDVWGGPLSESSLQMGRSLLSDIPTWHPVDQISQGFTSHEHLGSSGLIHMNGRVYDPFLGRFLSPDPILQFANSQWFSGYGYVNNNPLGYTDPSGYIGVRSISKALQSAGRAINNPGSWLRGSGKKLNRWVINPDNQRFVAATAVSALAAAYNPFAGYGIYSAMYSAGSGFVSGYIAGNGDLRSAAIRGASAFAFAGIGDYFTDLSGVGYDALKAASHGIVGGISTMAAGGSFGSGFVAAALSEGFTVLNIYDSLGASSVPTGPGGYVYNAMLSGIVGGLGSEISGGRFEDGALSAALGRLFNEITHRVREYYTVSLAARGGAKAVSGGIQRSYVIDFASGEVREYTTYSRSLIGRSYRIGLIGSLEFGSILTDDLSSLEGIGRSYGAEAAIGFKGASGQYSPLSSNSNHFGASAGYALGFGASFGIDVTYSYHTRTFNIYDRPKAYLQRYLPFRLQRRIVYQ